MNVYVYLIPIIIAIAVAILGVLGYLEKIFGRKFPRRSYIILLAVFILFSILQLAFTIYKQISSEVQISELSLRSSAIQTIQLRVSIDAITPNHMPGDKETSIGIMSSLALFSKDMTRYRFVTDYSFSNQQISDNTSRLTLIYEPEDPLQLYGRQISFLENMDTLAFDYSSFFKSINFEPGSMGNTIDVDVLLNGTYVFTLHNSATPGVLASGPCKVDISGAFSNISKSYSAKLKANRQK
jgi:hypothetical protein